MKTLNEQLSALVAENKSKIPEEIVKVMQAADLDLAGTGIVENIVGVGEKFPEITLPDATGKQVNIQELLEKGPVVISFYRGGWCPYCNLELRELQKFIPEFEKLNATLVAISPETPDNSLDTKQRNELTFPVLSDKGNVLSKQLKLTFNLKSEIIDIYNNFGLDIEKFNGDTNFELPIPATYVVGTDGLVKFAEANTNYTQRTEPSDILDVLK